MSDSSWTENQISRLRELWPSGDSCSAIGQDAGVRKSKNAVVGKARRLKLAARPSPIGRQGATPSRPYKRKERPKPTHDGLGRPILWTGWYNKLPLAQREAISAAQHASSCAYAGRVGLMSSCTCGASQPGAERNTPVSAFIPPAYRVATAVAVAAGHAQLPPGKLPPNVVVLLQRRRSTLPGNDAFASHQWPPERKCLFPYGEVRTPSYRVCGMDVETPGPYCEECRGRCYVPNQRRSDGIRADAAVRR